MSMLEVHATVCTGGARSRTACRQTSQTRGQMAQRRTAGELGEFPLVEAIVARFPQGSAVLLGPGDDAAAVSIPTGVAVASIDLLVQDRHFRLDWSSASDVG